MEYLIRLVQNHETFRKPELEALARIANVNLKIISYNQYVGSSSSYRYSDTNIVMILTQSYLLFCPLL